MVSRSARVGQAFGSKGVLNNAAKVDVEAFGDRDDFAPYWDSGGTYLDRPTYSAIQEIENSDSAGGRILNRITLSPTAVDPQGTINPSPVPTGLPTEDQDWTTRMPSSAPSQAPAPMPTVLPGHPSPQPVTAPTANPVAAPAAPPVAPPTPAATCFTPGDTNANLNTKIGNMASTTLTALLGTDNSGPNPITVSIINQVNSNPTQVSFDSGSYELTLVIPADTDLNTLSIFTQSGNSVDTGNTEIQITEQGCDAITMPIVTNSVSAAFCPTKNEGFASAVLLKASESQSLRHGMFKEDCVTKTSEQGNNGPVFKV